MPSITTKTPRAAPTPIPAFAPVDNAGSGDSGARVAVLVEAGTGTPLAPGEAVFELVELVLADKLTTVALARTA